MVSPARILTTGIVDLISDALEIVNFLRDSEDIVNLDQGRDLAGEPSVTIDREQKSQGGR